MNKKSKKCFAIILTIITLVVGMISMLAYYYKNRLPIGLWVNGIYCTGKTIDEVIQVLNPNTSVNRIEVQYINSQGIETNMPIYPEDFGEEIILIDTSSGEVLNEILKREKQFFLTNRKINSSITYQYNENELTTKVNELWDELDISEKKATDVLSISNGTEGFYLEDPKKTILKESKCKEAIIEAIKNQTSIISLKDSSYLVEPTYTIAEKKMMLLWKKIEDAISYEYVIRFGDHQEVINKKTLSDWLIFEFSNREWNEIINTEGNWNECNKILSSMDMDQISEISITYDEKQIKEYWKELAEKYDTVNIQRKFTTILGKEITLKESDYGNQIYQKEEVKVLCEFLGGIQKSFIRIPEYSKRAAAQGLDDIGPNYVEVDMEHQRLYYIEDEVVKFETDIVTGNEMRKMSTPQMICTVYGKQKNRVLRGPGYASPVKYWMPIYRGIGLHDANWRSEFGGEIYKTNGSHGCINIPSDRMEELYNMVEVGTPVILYTSSG